VLAGRFGVSWEYVRKVRNSARKGHRRRLIQSRFGVRSRVTAEGPRYMLALVEAQADITIADCAIGFAPERAWKSVGPSLRTGSSGLACAQKKSLTPSSGIAKPTVSGALSSTGAS